MSTKSHQARETIKREKQAGTLVNASGRLPTKAAVFLDNGTVIASPFSVRVLMNAIERSNSKQANPKRANETIRLRVYDAVDEQISEDDENDNLSEKSDEINLQSFDYDFD